MISEALSDIISRLNMLPKQVNQLTRRKETGNPKMKQEYISMKMREVI